MVDHTMQLGPSKSNFWAPARSLPGQFVLLQTPKIPEVLCRLLISRLILEMAVDHRL